MKSLIATIVSLLLVSIASADSREKTSIYSQNCSPVVHAFHVPDQLPALKRPVVIKRTSSFAGGVKVACRSLRDDEQSTIPDIETPEILDLYRNYGYNEAVQRNVQNFSKFKTSFSRRLVRSGRYLDIMSNIITDEGLPPELVYLPLIESAFKVDAYSHKHASGPWQLMSRTAKKLGLKVDWWVDERRDPVKSTRAAAQYLKYLFRKFRSWNLVLAAYNAGESRIRYAVRKAGSDDFWVLRKSRFLVRETKNYVPSYIAATSIAMDPEAFGFENLVYHSPLTYEEVVIRTPMSLDVIARLTGVTEWEIKDLNPELRRWCTPPDVSEYTLRIPSGTKEMFFAGLEETKIAELLNLKFYEVQRGDTVAKIAQKIGAPVQKIIHMNGLGKKAMIIAGKSIVLPHDI